MRGSYLDREAVEAEIDRMRWLGFDELRALWRTTLRASPPSVLSKDLVARFKQLRKAPGRRRPGGKGAADRPRRLKPGTVLVREYQGERYTRLMKARDRQTTKLPQPTPVAPPPTEATPRQQGLRATIGETDFCMQNFENCPSLNESGSYCHCGELLSFVSAAPHANAP